MSNTPDVQSLPDKRDVTINRVGVKNIRYPIIVEDRANTSQHTVAWIDIFVELSRHNRGTHMSRFLEVLNRYHKENLIENLPDFLNDVKKTLDAESAFVRLDFPYFIEKQAPVSGSKSLLGYDCEFKASYSKDYELVIGVKVPITTLCPCSKEISDRGAHNQRSYVLVEVLMAEFIWLEELIEMIESVASCEVYPILKRSDEKYVTERAYDNPRFVEDIVREMTLKLRVDKRISEFKIESVNQESIHDHDAYATVWSNGFHKR